MLVGLFACAGRAGRIDAPSGAPPWIEDGTGFRELRGGVLVLDAVGTAREAGPLAPDVARQAAENRARADVRRLLEVLAERLAADYRRATPERLDWRGDRLVPTCIAHGWPLVELRGHWRAPDGTHYALARLVLSSFLEKLQKVEELHLAVRSYARANAARLHRALMQAQDRGADPLENKRKQLERL